MPGETFKDVYTREHDQHQQYDLKYAILSLPAIYCRGVHGEGIGVDLRFVGCRRVARVTRRAHFGIGTAVVHELAAGAIDALVVVHHKAHVIIEVLGAANRRIVEHRTLRKRYVAPLLAYCYVR